jgi:mutator protein MutT
MKRVEVAIAVVFRDGLVLICRRRDDDEVLGGYWELPGGKLEPNETIERCVVREVEEEVGVEVRPVLALNVIEYEYPTVRVRLHPYVCEHVRGEPRAIGRWVSASALGEYRFPPANDGLLGELLAYVASAARAPGRGGQS